MNPRQLFVIVSFALLVPVSLAAQATTTPLTGTEVFDPLNLLQNPNGGVGAILNPGELTCPGALPTGNPMQPCPAGSRIKVRGTTLTSRLASQDALLAGWFTIIGNADLDSNAAGVAWGKFRLELDACGGVFKGSWTGERSQMEGVGWVSRISGVGLGTADCVEGQQLKFSETIVSFAPVSVMYLGQIDAEVLTPASR
jgi:hypothetical protein